MKKQKTTNLYIFNWNKKKREKKRTREMISYIIIYMFEKNIQIYLSKKLFYFSMWCQLLNIYFFCSLWQSKKIYKKDIFASTCEL